MKYFFLIIKFEQFTFYQNLVHHFGKILCLQKKSVKNKKNTIAAKNPVGLFVKVIEPLDKIVPRDDTICFSTKSRPSAYSLPAALIENGCSITGKNKNTCYV